MIDGVRICLRCGTELPITSGQSRKYCDACAAERNRELTRERLAKAREKAAKVKREKQEAKDRAYCKPCIYRASSYGENLCDYILIEKKPRGCKAGEGCNQRTLKEVG